MNSLLVGERLLQVEPTLQLSADVQVVIEAVEQGLSDGISCWRSFAVERREGSAIEGQGLFATQFIAERSLVAIKQGHVIDTITVKDNRDILRGSQQQIGPNQ